MFVLMMFTWNDNQLIINNKSIIFLGVGPNVKCLNGNFLSIYKNQFKVGKNLQLEINIMTDMFCSSGSLTTFLTIFSYSEGFENVSDQISEGPKRR